MLIFHFAMRQTPEILVLAGGLGTRMWSLTGGSIPKCELPIRHNIRGIDILLQGLLRIGLEATFSASHYYYRYSQILSQSFHRMLWQKSGGTAEAVSQKGNTVLTIAPDCLFDPTEISKMIEFHIPGTITWAVTDKKLPLMNNYEGMDIEARNAIVGRTNCEIVRSPIMIIEPDIIKQFRAPSDRPEGEDLYLDVLPKIERENAIRIRMGKPSLLNAYKLNSYIFDYGTPERFRLLPEVINEIIRL